MFQALFFQSLIQSLRSPMAFHSSPAQPSLSPASPTTIDADDMFHNSSRPIIKSARGYESNVESDDVPEAQKYGFFADDDEDILLSPTSSDERDRPPHQRFESINHPNSDAVEHSDYYDNAGTQNGSPDAPSIVRRNLTLSLSSFSSFLNNTNKRASSYMQRRTSRSRSSPHESSKTPFPPGSDRPSTETIRRKTLLQMPIRVHIRTDVTVSEEDVITARHPVPTITSGHADPEAANTY
jgi:hypothetical protein